MHIFICLYYYEQRNIDPLHPLFYIIVYISAVSKRGNKKRNRKF